MTLTTLITLNAALGAALAYGLHHLLAHGIRYDRHHRDEIVAVASHEPEQIAA
jgi:hypothetical protein